MITTTLNKIRSHKPWLQRQWKILTVLNKDRSQDEAIPFSEIVDKLGFDVALWCCRTAPEYDRAWCLFAAWCCRKVQHLSCFKGEMEREAVKIAERYGNNKATREDLLRFWIDGEGALILCNAARSAASATGCFEGEVARKAMEATQKKEFLRIVNSA